MLPSRGQSPAPTRHGYASGNRGKKTRACGPTYTLPSPTTGCPVEGAADFGEFRVEACSDTTCLKQTRHNSFDLRLSRASGLRSARVLFFSWILCFCGFLDTPMFLLPPRSAGN